MPFGHERQLSMDETIFECSPFSRASGKYKTMPVNYNKEKPMQGWDGTGRKLTKSSKQHHESKTTHEQDTAKQLCVHIGKKVTSTEKGVEDLRNASQHFTITETKEEDDTPCQDGGITDADEAWLASLETVETSLKFNDPPEEFLQILYRFVNDNEIHKLFWSHSYDEQNSFIIFVERITSDLLEALEKQLQQDCPKLSVKIVKTDSMGEKLGTIIVEEDCNPCHELVQWTTTDRTATCEVLLRGKQPHKNGRSSLFGVTSAHLLLSNEEMLRMENVNPQDDQHLLIREFRNNLLQRMDNHVYKMEDNIAKQIVHLSDHPMIAYRFFKDEARNNNFMTDIVIFQIELGNEEIINTALQRDHCRLTSIKGLSQDILSQMKGEVRVFAKDREGVVVTSLSHMARGGSPPLGHHISFVIVEGKPFRPGDSGSVIYTRSGNNRYAIAILKERRPEPQQHIYNAILLGQAIDEIQQDYPQFIRDVSLYLPNLQE